MRRIAPCAASGEPLQDRIRARILVDRGPVPFSESKEGGATGDRTPDPHTASVVLSQLSYRP